MSDDLESWFNEHYPKSEQPEVTEEFSHLEPDYNEDDDFMTKLQEENEQLKQQLQNTRDTADVLARTVEAMTEMVKHYQDASPLLYKLLTDLELDEYRATDYELMIQPGTISTERAEMSMEWIIRRVYPEVIS